LDVGIVGDDHVGLLGDQVGQRLSARVGAPVGIAHDDLDAQRLELALEPGEPPLRQIEAHCHRQISDGLALQRLEIRLAEWLLQALGPS
jgi:hypothetical protein